MGDAWAHSNARAARLLRRVIEILRTVEPEIEIPLSGLVGKLLCSNNIILSNAVLRAAEKYTFDINGSRALLRALGLGSGVGLKLPLDTADYAAINGATEYACTALWSVSTMIERNYSEHMRYADIALYRLLYLKGPVQAWAIQLAQGQMGLGCRFSTPTLLYFMDDCAVERPELIPYINECFYDGRASNEGEYLIRLEFLDKLLTGHAKRALLEHLYSPPLDASDKKIGKCMERLLSLADDPRLGDAAVKCIADMIEEEDQPRRCIHQMIETHGDKLPEAIRLAYLQKVPKTPHLTPMVPKNRYTDSRQRNEFDDQIEQWKKMWDEGIRKAVEAYYERQRAASEYWEKIKNQSPEC